jgi:penicillin-binding protein-related factor A (putative recombinase)
MKRLRSHQEILEANQQYETNCAIVLRDLYLALLPTYPQLHCHLEANGQKGTFDFSGVLFSGLLLPFELKRLQSQDIFPVLQLHTANRFYQKDTKQSFHEIVADICHLVQANKTIEQQRALYRQKRQQSISLLESFSLHCDSEQTLPQAKTPTTIHVDTSGVIVFSFASLDKQTLGCLLDVLQKSNQ